MGGFALWLICISMVKRHDGGGRGFIWINRVRGKRWMFYLLFDPV